VIGSTDSHTGLSTAEKDNYFGKVTLREPSADPIRFEEVVADRPAPKGHQSYASQIASAGLAAVWARDVRGDRPLTTRCCHAQTF